MVNFPITINGITIMSSEIVPYIRKCESKNAIKYIVDKTSCSFSEAEEVVNEIKNSLYNKGFSNTSYKNSDTFKSCPKCGKQYPYLRDHCAECGYSTQAYKNRMKKLQEDVEKPIVKNIPRCPICQSTNLSKITTTKKATKIGLFGILGTGDISKTWKCNNCGSKF
ncbi:hypothetical protein [Faecalicatena contorta]|uniref:hypothetical protein n=1 Tax=Faecalicatena contorta TaxID=39482 RepID=UPI001F2A666F|nr:hypothetical protein [Faecalicatena contorta]MCF2554419.1 hypothetical protein [Faecalicatena contorta]